MKELDSIIKQVDEIAKKYPCIETTLAKQYINDCKRWLIRASDKKGEIYGRTKNKKH